MAVGAHHETTLVELVAEVCIAVFMGFFTAESFPELPDALGTAASSPVVNPTVDEYLKTVILIRQLLDGEFLLEVDLVHGNKLGGLILFQLFNNALESMLIF